MLCNLLFSDWRTKPLPKAGALGPGACDRTKPSSIGNGDLNQDAPPGGHCLMTTTYGGNLQYGFYQLYRVTVCSSGDSCKKGNVRQEVGYIIRDRG